MALVVRRATPADADAIARLNLAFNDLRTTSEHIADHIANRSQFETPFVAEHDGEIVGMACLRLLPALCDAIPYAELTELCVDPMHQRRGIGSALVRRIEDEARAGGAAELVLITAWRNTRAHAGPATRVPPRARLRPLHPHHAPLPARMRASPLTSPPAAAAAPAGRWSAG